MPQQWIPHQPLIQGNQRGIALVGAFLVLLVVFAAAAVLATQTFTAGHISERQEHHTRALYAAEAGIAWAEQAIFNDWGVVNNGTATDTMQSFQARLNGNFNLPADVGGGLVTVPNGAGPVQLFANYAMPNSSATVQSATVSRLDNGPTSSQFTVVSTGADTFGNTREVTSVFQVNGRDVNYNDFALLARDVTCIMCHATIDNVDRYYDTTPGWNDVSRVKVGVTDNMMLRASGADTKIAGTLYIQGNVVDKNGGLMSGADWTASTVDSYTFDPATGNIIEDGSGNPTQTDLVDAPIDPATGLPVANGNLYLGYATDAATQKQIDGELPTDFFTIFEDLNGDRAVSVADVEATKAKFTGEISGGVIYEVPFGSTYASGTLPGTGNLGQVGDSTVADGTYHNGNLILVGTDADPIILDGAVGVNGDVMISGVVQGQGELYASGNVYVVGDVTYKNDASLPWGHYTDASGTDVRNSLFIGSGNNILIGDYQRKDGTVDTGNHATSPTFSFTMKEVTLFNRTEWAKTQPTLPDQSGTLVPNPDYDPSHQPVYFNMGPGEPIYIYNGMTKKGKGTYFDPATGVWLGKESAGGYQIYEDKNFNGVLDGGEDVDGDGVLDQGYLSHYTEAEAQAMGATISSYNPTMSGAAGNPWIDPQDLASIWDQVDASRTAGPLHVDAAMRTSQSIFTLSRSSTSTGGKTLVNGAIVAAHVGMLSGQGLQLNFDRVAASASAGVTSEDPALTRVARWYK